MRQGREIVRLGSEGISKHQIARRTGMAPSTVRETLKRFAASGLSGRWAMRLQMRFWKPDITHNYFGTRACGINGMQNKPGASPSGTAIQLP
jgi:hypothetical protein